MVSLGYDSISLGREIGGSDVEHETGPGGEFCRICREKGVEAMQERRSKSKGGEMVFERWEGAMEQGVGGADMEVVAVPFVFRLLLSELAAMGIAVQVGVD